MRWIMCVVLVLISINAKSQSSFETLPVWTASNEKLYSSDWLIHAVSQNNPVKEMPDLSRHPVEACHGASPPPGCHDKSGIWNHLPDASMMFYDPNT